MDSSINEADVNNGTNGDNGNRYSRRKFDVFPMDEDDTSTEFRLKPSSKCTVKRDSRRPDLTA